MPAKRVFPVVRARFPRIVDYTQSKLRSFMVDGRARGKGRRHYFRKLTDAKTCADQLAIERENHGTALLAFNGTRLSVMAKEAAVELKAWGKTIDDAVRHYVEFLKADAERCKSPLIRDCVAQFLTSRQRDVERGTLARRSLIELRQCANHLVAAAGGLHVIEFDADAVTRFLDSWNVAPRTRNNIRLRLSALFAFCKSKKWIAVNPCSEIRIKIPRHEVVVLTVDEVEKLLRCAEASGFRDVLCPYVAICVWAGLRPFECRQLDWCNVDFKTNHIFVAASTSKKRESRYVRMEPTLVQWLRAYARSSGRICGANFRKQWESLIAAAGYAEHRPWPQDSMRHTAASMLLTLKRDRALVCEELGTAPATLSRFYRFPITQEDAARFWALRPTVV